MKPTGKFAFPLELPELLTIIFNKGEKYGMKEIAKRFGEQVTGYIVLEGMRLGQIYNAGLPVRRYRLTIKTEGGHAWNHTGRKSAIHELLAVGSKLVKLQLPKQIRSSLNIGKISSFRILVHHTFNWKI